MGDSGIFQPFRLGSRSRDDKARGREARFGGRRTDSGVGVELSAAHAGIWAGRVDRRTRDLTLAGARRAEDPAGATVRVPPQLLPTCTVHPGGDERRWTSRFTGGQTTV